MIVIIIIIIIIVIIIVLLLLLIIIIILNLKWITIIMIALLVGGSIPSTRH